MNFRKTITLLMALLLLPLAGAHALITARHSQTTTLLPNGDILVVGGEDALGIALNVEIYRLSNAAYSAPTGTRPDLTTARSSHTATLMSDGNVLVAGGFDGANTPLNSMQIFNTVTESWDTEFIPDALVFRAGHTATLLNIGPYAGGVLLCGGQQSVVVTDVANTCSIFRASPYFFGPAPLMSSARAGHTATSLMGGRVFVSGGVIGAGPTATYLPNNEIYNPEILPFGGWQTATALLQGRTDHSAVALNNGNILISGGFNGDGTGLFADPGNKLYSPEEAWYVENPIAALDQNAGNHGYIESAEIFDANGGRVPVTGDDYQVMPYRNSRHAAALLPDGKQHLLGGYGNIVPTNFEYDTTMESGSRVYGTKIGITSTTVNTNSIFNFRLNFELARKVDGRLVNADIYMAEPKEVGNPSLKLENVEIFLLRSTSVVDGLPVGNTNSLPPGIFDNLVGLYQPTGRAHFSPQDITVDPTIVQTGYFYHDTPLEAGQTSALYQNPVTVTITTPQTPPLTGTLTNAITGTLYGPGVGAGCTWSVNNPAAVVNVSGNYSGSGFDGILHGDATTASGPVYGDMTGVVSGTANGGTLPVDCVTLPAPPEDFEVNSWSVPPAPYLWTLEGSPSSVADWDRQGTIKHGGSLAAKAGALGNSQSNWMQRTMVLNAPDNISFWYRVSSERSYDYLEFWIDSARQARWSGRAVNGEEVWKSVGPYAVAAGVHTFKWVYTTDFSNLYGDNTAWVDDIVWPTSANTFTTTPFPITGAITGGTAFTSTVNNQSVTSSMLTCTGGSPVCANNAYYWESNSGSGKDSVTGPINGTIAGTAVAQSGTNVMMNISFKVPKIYVGGVVSGSATITGGGIDDPEKMWKISMTGGSIEIPPTPVTLSGADGRVATPITIIGLVGNITNSTTMAIVSYQEGAVAAVSTLKMNLRYTSTEINIAAAKYDFAVSTLMVREMVFADNLAYDPGKALWEFGVPFSPTFNEAAIISRSADLLISGGRNCEVVPLTNCARGLKNFQPDLSPGNDTVYIAKAIIPWPSVKGLNTKRAFHTSTVLPTGAVLTCGGSDGTATLSSCEIRNPLTKEWSYTGNMNSPRRLHTATLLPNGTVLATGGGISASTHVVDTAEIYFPDSGRWVPTESMKYPRANHTATLLSDGNVLVAGGNTTSGAGLGYSNTSEIYFTTKAAWGDTIGPTLGTARAQHTATLLKTGNVLVTGGINGTGATNSAEVFNFATQQWAVAPGDPTLNRQRYAHTATLLMDGRVLVSGGSDGIGSLDTAEVYNGASWTNTENLPTAGAANKMKNPRANHRATLLPNGKVILTGGEKPGLAYAAVEDFSPDFPWWMAQSSMTNRSNHTAVLTQENTVLAIGGWDGAKYLSSVEEIPFAFVPPDSSGFDPQDRRNPAITGSSPMMSNGVTAFDRGQNVTLLSDTSNFHNISEASGGGSGAMNSSAHNPRVYMQAIDSPSGFLTDLTTWFYSSTNASWDKTVSSITITMPASPGEMPWGWYHMRVGANGQFSEGRTVQVTIPRPLGQPSMPQPWASPNWRGVSSITWEWDYNTLWTPDVVNGYGVYSATNGVFITTLAYSSNLGVIISPVRYLQDGLSPNTMASILVNGYNLGGGGPLTASSTYFTLAAAPSLCRVTGATFNSATITWETNGNAPHTAYQVTLAENNDFTGAFSTAVPFSQNNTNNSATIENLTPNVRYYFRVQAQNGKKGIFGAGGDVPTAFSNSDSTITVSDVSGLQGTALSSTSIKWSWAPAVGAEFYDVYNVTAGTDAAIFLGSPITNAFPQLNLLTNAAYKVAVNAGHSSGGIIRGPVAYSEAVYTMAELPSLGTPEPLAVTTDSIKLLWLRNGNEIGTVYTAEISLTPGFSTATAVSVTGSSATFTGLNPNVLYYGRVAVKNGNGFALAPVELGHMYTLAKTPGNVLVTTISMSGVGLSWEANGNSAITTYEVRGTTESSFLISYSTYIRFSENYHGFTKFINGLLTSTNYLFEVEAKNGDGVKSGPTPAPAVLTLAGPCGTIGGCAPTGSVGGTSDPSRSVTIAGILPSGRGVALTLPANTYASATSIAISSSTNDYCASYRPFGFPLIEVSIYSAGDAQPQAPVTLSFDMTVDESTLIGSYKDRVALARFNTKNGDCLPLPTDVELEAVIPHITADLNHFSVFQLIVIPPASDLNSVQVFPNPFSPGNGYVTIRNLPASSKVRIYSLSGDKVWEGTGGSSGVAKWKGVNTAGRPVASGIYLAVIESSAGRKVKKIAVER